MRLTKRIGALFAAVALTLSLAACEKDAAKADLDQPRLSGDVVPTDFELRAPDKLTIFNNVDSHANIVRLCIDKVAFFTVSNSYVGLATPAVTRVPEWDAYCAS